jgi:hypothetical protein
MVSINISLLIVSFDMTTENVNFFVKVLSCNGLNATKIHSYLVNELGDDNCVSIRRIQQLAREFKEGREDTVRIVGSGRPRSTRTEENIRMVSEMVEADGGVPYRVISDLTNLPKTSVQEIIK